MPREFKIRSFDFQSRTDMKVRQTSGYGDNAMEDPTATNESVEDDSQVDELHRLLSRFVPDEAIANGATLSPGGFEKAAAKMGISAEEVEALLDTLRTKLNGDDDRAIMGEDTSASPRYSWEHDGLGSVTVRDGTTGEDFFYGGSKGFAILSGVEELSVGSPTEQAFLALYCVKKKVNEAVMDEDEIDEEEVDFLGEISAEVSTFNFPWKTDKDFGTGTAEFRGDPEHVKVRVVDIRDRNGEHIRADKSLKDSLRDQAIDFIPKA